MKMVVGEGGECLVKIAALVCLMVLVKTRLVRTVVLVKVAIN